MPSLVTPSFSKGCTQNRYRRFGNDGKIKMDIFSVGTETSVIYHVLCFVHKKKKEKKVTILRK